MTGEGFGFREVMILVGEDSEFPAFAEVRVEDGSFKKRVTIPADAPVGPLTIVVDDEQGTRTALTFNVAR